MSNGPWVWSVVGSTLAFAVGTIAVLFVSAWLFGRHIQRKMQNSSTVQEQMLQLMAERHEAIRRNLQWTSAVSFLLIGLAALAVFLAINGRPALLGLVIFLALPAALVVGGSTIVQRQFVVVSKPFGPYRLLTGEAAVRRGKLLIAIGLCLLALCSFLVLAGVVSVGLAPSHPGSLLPTPP